MPERAARGSYIGGPRFYVVTRLAFMLGAPAPLVFGFAAGTTRLQIILYAAGLAVIEAGGIAVLLRWDRELELSGALLAVLPYTDLLGMTMMGLVATPAVRDPLYPAFLLLSVVYALLLPKRRAAVIVALTCVSYAAVASLQLPGDYFSVLVFLEKVSAIAAVAWMVSVASEMQTQRVRRLQLVSHISQALHSSLDEEVMRTEALEQLADLLDLRDWQLSVVDTETEDVLFEATVVRHLPGTGDEQQPAVRMLTEEHKFTPDPALSCTSMLRHDDTEVFFCAADSELEHLSAEERIVLDAVCRELALAVENRRLFGETKHLSVTDALTGLYNRRHLGCRVVEETGRCRRYGQPLSLLMIDGDDFKHVNDVHGHDVGDEVLVELSQLMLASVREADVVARYGGEEFCVLLPETDVEGAARAAENLCATVAGHHFVNGVRLTVSIGVATYPDAADSAAELQRAADNALYAAKTSGKSRVCVHEPRAEFAS